MIIYILNKGDTKMEFNKLVEDYGCLAFTDDVMKERIPKSTYKAFHESLDKGEELSKECATVIANAMKIWAVEHGATHFTHWFTPMTGLTAEKHDAFLPHLYGHHRRFPPDQPSTTLQSHVAHFPFGRKQRGVGSRKPFRK